jgi:hypothetical protein
MTRALLLTIALAISCLGAAAGAFLASRASGPDLSIVSRAGSFDGARSGARAGSSAGQLAGYRAGYHAGYHHAYGRAYRLAYLRALSG